MSGGRDEQYALMPPQERTRLLDMAEILQGGEGWRVLETQMGRYHQAVILDARGEVVARVGPATTERVNRFHMGVARFLSGAPGAIRTLLYDRTYMEARLREGRPDLFSIRGGRRNG